MNMTNRQGIGSLFALGAVIAAAALVLTACGNTNDHSAPTMNAVVSFAGAGMSTGLISGPPAPEEPVVSLVVGAVVITYRDTPVQNIEVANLSDQQKNDLTDDALQSAAYLTIVDLPLADDSVSFLIPPATSGNWQLVGVGSRIHIDVLQDFDDNKDAATWFGFTEEFEGGKINPGDTKDLELSPGCSLDSPPENSC
jgi:hypothetical protein